MKGPVNMKIILEYRSVRISNSLIDGLMAGEFSAVQLRIILALARASFELRGPVSVSQHELARAINTRVSGGFCNSLDDLLTRGVLRISEPARGRRKTRYVLQRVARWWLSPPTTAADPGTSKQPLSEESKTAEREGR